MAFIKEPHDKIILFQIHQTIYFWIMALWKHDVNTLILQVK